MEIVLKSLASAVVTAIILIIAKISGPKLAGAIGGIPIVFAISYILITMQDKSQARPFLVGGGLRGNSRNLLQYFVDFSERSVH